MKRKLSVLVFAILAVIGAIFVGYWDMLASEGTELRTMARHALQRFSVEANEPRRTSALGSEASGPSDASNSPAARTPDRGETATQADERRTEERSDAVSPPASAEASRGEAKTGAPGADTTAGPASPQSNATESGNAAGDAPDTGNGRFGFDIVRAEPDGSLLAAGRGPANARIVLEENGVELGSDRTGASGDFVIVLDDPLGAGAHDMRLRAFPEDGPEIASRETAIVDIPDSGRDEELLALIETPDAPTRLVDLPGARPSEPRPGDEGDAAGDTRRLAAATDRSSREPANSGIDAPSRQAAGAVRPEASPAEAEADPFRIEAVEIEGDRVFVAGAAPPGARLQVYVNDEALAEGRADSHGRFLTEASERLEPGDHTVRVDRLAASGDVVQRVAVPFAKPEGGTLAAVSPDLAPLPAGNASGQLDPPSRIASVGPAETARRTMDDGSSASSGNAVSGGSRSVRPDDAQAPADGGESALAAAQRPVPTRLQAPLERRLGRVIIRKGDTLWRISRETYGRGMRYTVIYLANGDQIIDPNLIYPGQIFKMPPRSEVENPLADAKNEANDPRAPGDRTASSE